MMQNDYKELIHALEKIKLNSENLKSVDVYINMILDKGITPEQREAVVRNACNVFNLDVNGNPIDATEKLKKEANKLAASLKKALIEFQDSFDEESIKECKDLITKLENDEITKDNSRVLFDKAAYYSYESLKRYAEQIMEADIIISYLPKSENMNNNNLIKYREELFKSSSIMEQYKLSLHLQEEISRHTILLLHYGIISDKDLVNGHIVKR